MYKVFVALHLFNEQSHSIQYRKRGEAKAKVQQYQPILGIVGTGVELFLDDFVLAGLSWLSSGCLSFCFSLLYSRNIPFNVQTVSAHI